MRIANILTNVVSQIRTECAHRFREEEARKNMTGGLPAAPWNRPTAYLQRQAYSLVLACRGQTPLWGTELEKLALARLVRARRPLSFENDPFHLAIVALEPLREQMGERWLADSSRFRLANELAAADLLGVRVRDLSGFISQLGRLDRGWDQAVNDMFAHYEAMDEWWDSFPKRKSLPPARIEGVGFTKSGAD